MHRFAVYFAGTLLLWVIWPILGGELVLKAGRQASGWRPGGPLVGIRNGEGNYKNNSG
jgi:hypothetical protein